MICDICKKNINDDYILEGQINIKYKDKDGIEKEKEKEGKLCISCLEGLSKYMGIPITIVYEEEDDE
ncbi:hypothetical protein [uncultured Brachyspira sp.]|uniref:hypothetical protein n=1 Tax=uncultured Brachyspira sp. TaxID=221953 RepID=UPI00261BFB6B|nr:hypothetical protein [uncultured Brachyspira sp.]